MQIAAALFYMVKGTVCPKNEYFAIIYSLMSIQAAFFVFKVIMNQLGQYMSVHDKEMEKYFNILVSSSYKGTLSINVGFHMVLKPLYHFQEKFTFINSKNVTRCNNQVKSNNGNTLQ